MSRRGAFLFIFFTGGFAAVLYQTVWQRLLTLFSGADIFSITIVVSAFMAGMGLGSLAGGHLADRLTGRGAVIAFAICELAIAIFAAASAAIYYDWLYLSVGAHLWPRTVTALTIFGVMLWPTLFMGMSLPLAARILSTDPQRPARWLPALYGWNTLGAATGSLATILLLLPNVDLRACLLIGAACSSASAVLALALLRGSRPADSGTATAVASAAPAAPAAGPTLGLPVWLALYALAGFTALSLEIVWFRVFGVALKSNSRTFGALLGIYLVGIGLGALAAEWKRFRAADPRRAFLMVQAAVPITATALIALTLAAIGRVPLLAPLTEYFASANPPGARTIASGRVVLLYATVPVALMLPSCLLMGYGFGALHQAAQRDLASLGRRVGWLQAANIAGSTLGAALTGLVLLEVFGAPGTLRLLVLCAVPFLAVLAAVDRGIRRAAIGAVAAAATLVLLPGGHAFWSGWHATDPGRTIVREDATGVVLLREEPAHERTDLLLSGFSQSWLPYGSVHTVLGVLPALVHPAPRRVAVIGLGSGDTVFSIGGRDTITAIESIEIVRPQLAALQALNQQQRYPALQMLLADPRVTHHFADGRSYLRARPGLYDIIEADAIPPWGAYAGNLYSVEFFERLRACLREGGLAVTWTPTDRTRTSFLSVFPHVLMFRYVAIGSDTPIPFDTDRIRALLSTGFTRDYFDRGAINIDQTMKSTLEEMPRRYGPDANRSLYTDVNRDLFPQDEFGRR
jgi:predicted membrane-bound spermidine synthase